MSLGANGFRCRSSGSRERCEQFGAACKNDRTWLTLKMCDCPLRLIFGDCRSQQCMTASHVEVFADVMT